MRVGIDTGGTFTDCVYVEDGVVRVLKLFSTPRDPSQAICAAIEQLVPAGESAEILHGTTVGTNTLLERKGARVAFVTTAGFEDTLGIGRQARPRLYDLFASPAPPLVPAELRFGARERIAPDGAVIVPLSAAELKRLRRKIAAARPEAAAVSLLFSFANPEHERAIAAALAGLGIPISVSHQVLPEFREYERASTLAVNAYLAPRMSHYIGGLEQWVAARPTEPQPPTEPRPNPAGRDVLADRERERFQFLSFAPRHPEMMNKAGVQGDGPGSAGVPPAGPLDVHNAHRGRSPVPPVERSELLNRCDAIESRARRRDASAPRGSSLVPARRDHSSLPWPGGALRIMQSSGGITTAAVAAREPVRTVLSGPAGGVVGAAAVARRAGFERIITFDMGGTSTDVALVEGELRTSGEGTVAGFPVAVPMLDIHTVGAGGGSLARFDAGGALRVGPESAGADPGPICYGRGEGPTVTDANLLLGRIHPDFFLGGEVRLDQARARQMFARFLKRQRHFTGGIEAFCQGIVRVANAAMEKAIRVISIERGYDPRDFALVSFGGAGPLHAGALAAALRIPRVLVPRDPGALSALGILLSDVVKDYSCTVMLPPGHESLGTRLAEIERQAREEMRREGFGAGVEAAHSADLRYVGQGHELNIPCAGPGTGSWSARLAEAFHRAHETRYGYADRARPVEVVNLRVRLRAPVGEAFQPARGRRRATGNERAGNGRQAVAKRAGGRYPLYQRELLRPGDRLAGPAVIAEYSATTFLAAGFRAAVDQWGNMIIHQGRSD